jgi:hypothetical protein
MTYFSTNGKERKGLGKGGRGKELTGVEKSNDFLNVKPIDKHLEKCENFSRGKEIRGRGFIKGKCSFQLSIK